MLFNSVQFTLFLPVVVLLYYVLPGRAKRVWLLVASYFFYGCWNAAYTALIAISTLVTYACALLLAHIDGAPDGEGRKTRNKKWCVAASLVINLGILFVFKYFNFFAGAANRLLQHQLPLLELLLPVGISFYTFQALGYTIDVYRKTVPAERNLIDYALFVSFFPQLVAGPIERTGNLLPQLKRVHDFDAENVKRGLLIMLWGYFLKLVIADRAAMAVNAIYNASVSSATGFQLLLATVLFAFQIYGDFAGYSLIAMGAARTMGVELMQNFRQPYLATSVTDFWRRWHISLSGWFRDYLYFPLGGSRGKALRTCINLGIVFLASGLWHGADYTFVAWGMLHGAYMIFERLTERPKNALCARLHIDRNCRVMTALRTILTFAAVCAGWVFFRANYLKQALAIFAKIFAPWPDAGYRKGMLKMLGKVDWIVLGVSLVILLCVSLFEKRGGSVLDSLERRPRAVRWIVYYALAFAVILLGLYGPGYSESAFIYFQF